MIPSLSTANCDLHFDKIVSEKIWKSMSGVSILDQGKKVGAKYGNDVICLKDDINGDIDCSPRRNISYNADKEGNLKIQSRDIIYGSLKKPEEKYFKCINNKFENCEFINWHFALEVDYSAYGEGVTLLKFPPHKYPLASIQYFQDKKLKLSGHYARSPLTEIDFFVIQDIEILK